jgi:hypothetical protein
MKLMTGLTNITRDTETTDTPLLYNESTSFLAQSKSPWRPGQANPHNDHRSGTSTGPVDRDRRVDGSASPPSLLQSWKQEIHREELAEEDTRRPWPWGLVSFPSAVSNNNKSTDESRGLFDWPVTVNCCWSVTGQSAASGAFPAGHWLEKKRGRDPGERFQGQNWVKDSWREWMILGTHCTPSRDTNSAFIHRLIPPLFFHAVSWLRGKPCQFLG